MGFDWSLLNIVQRISHMFQYISNYIVNDNEQLKTKLLLAA